MPNSIETIFEKSTAYLIDNMRRIFFLLFFILCSKLGFSICGYDDRTLTEMLLQRKMGTIFSCKVISMSVPKPVEGYLEVYSGCGGGIDGTALVQILRVYFGNVDTSFITLKTGTFLMEDKSYLIYSEGNGRVFGCGGSCDQRMHELTGSPEDLSELKILDQFASVYKKNKSGKYTFLSSKKTVLAEGSFKKGVPTGIWKHYYSTGVIKTDQDFDSNRKRHYNSNGMLIVDNIAYKDSSVSLSYSNAGGWLNYRWVTIPNEKGSISTLYEYFLNGHLKLYESQINLTSGNGTTSGGKTGKYIDGYENGHYRLVGQHQNNRRVGLWKWYNEDGTFFTEFDYKDGATNQ